MTAPDLYVDDEARTVRAKPWVPHKPEDRLSIVTSRFLNAALEPPFYVTALADDDEGQRTMMQRVRGRQRGQEPGQLDFDVWQGRTIGNVVVPLATKLELKRGQNKPSAHQIVTIRKLMACGASPLVVWTLRETHDGLAGIGFHFRGNVETLLQKYQADLDALDRAAELTLSGKTPQKKSRARKSAPRYVAGKGMQRRAAKAGVRI
jgi:hypothetical protein